MNAAGGRTGGRARGWIELRQTLTTPADLLTFLFFTGDS